MFTQFTVAPSGLSMLNAIRVVAAFCLLTLTSAAGAASLADKLAPGMPHYFDSFDATQRPWEPGQPLNIEEVFKNYQYYEILLDRDGKAIVVNRYLRGSKAASEKYLVLPDGSLQKSKQ